ncbi:MAG: efflux transporter outer membrane subunit [Proteobacteria bacterium]|nr:efflux transporter outer membrane subunit [Pseudomonadota bacterium]
MISRSIRNAAMYGMLVAVVGCAAGPEYHRPSLPAPAQWTRETPAATVAAVGAQGTAQRFDPSLEVERRWWTRFGSRALDQLVADAFAHNPNVDAAAAALRAAQENLAAQRATFLPSVQIGYSPSRQQNAVGTLSPTLTSGAAQYTLHTTQLTIGYAPDVFGLNRRTVESLAAQSEQQRAQLDATYLTLAANVVAAVIQEASLRAQIDAMNDIIAVDAKSLDLLRAQAGAGYANGLDVAAQVGALASAQAGLPPLQKQLEQTRDQLAILVGKTPDQAGPDRFDLTTLELPATLPLALPAQAVGQRPDVRAAEALVKSASAQVGIAVANRLPQISINASYGGSAEAFSRMFDAGNVFWSVVGNAAMTVFDFGALKHRQGSAEAALDQAAAQYRAVALAAFQNVADVLYALDADARALVAAEHAESAAKTTLDLTRKQHEFGYVNALALYAAEQAWQQARIAHVQAQAMRLADTAALYQALGGNGGTAP